MRIIDYQYKGQETNPMDYSKVHLGKFNLLVGDTGSGKSRFLNTITNLAKFITQEKSEIKTGKWDISFCVNKNIFNWILTIKLDHNEPLVSYEKLTLLNDDNEIVYLERTKNKFTYLGKDLPLISREYTSIQLLKDEPKIFDIFNGFNKIIDRRFDSDTLKDATVLNVINPIDFKDINEVNINKYIFSNRFNINSKLYILEKVIPSRFKEITDVYKEIFPFITEVEICDFSNVNKSYRAPGITPVFRIKEKYIPDKIDLTQLSSGMKKVLIILTDIALMDEESIYIIDEYENSLGISAIDFLPDYLLEKENLCQMIITSHHPYLINNFPVKYWYLFSRNGLKINIIPGSTLEKKYSKSRQESFFQLINDPLYTSDSE